MPDNKAYLEYWASQGYGIRRASSCLPLMAVVGLLNNYSDDKLNWEGMCMGWDLADHACVQHRLNHGDLKDLDISKLSSLDRKYRSEGISEPIRR